MDTREWLDVRHTAWRMIEERLEIERQMLELVKSLKGRTAADVHFEDGDWEWAKRKLKSNIRRK